MNSAKIKRYTIPTQRGNRNKALITVICCLVLLTTAFVIFWDTVSLILPDFNTAVYKFNYPSSVSRKFVPFKDNMVFSCNEGIYCIDKKGNEKWMIPLVFDQPIIAASDYGIVASSKNRQTVYIIDKNGKSREFSTPHPVVNLKIAENGNIIAILDKQNYSGALEIYDAHGTPIFTWSAGSVLFVDAALSPNGRLLAISSIMTDAAELSCKVQLFNIYENSQPYAENAVGTNLVSQLKWVDNNKFVCVGDKAFITLDKKANQKWAYDYEDRVLNFVSIADKDNIVLALGADSLDLNMSIKSFNISGKLNCEFNYSGAIQSVSSNNKRIVICSAANANVYDKSFRLRETIKAEKEIYSGCITNGNTVFLDEGGFAQISNAK